VAERPRLGTKPAPTGSEAVTNTIGIVFVAAIAARTATSGAPAARPGEACDIAAFDRIVLHCQEDDRDSTARAHDRLTRRGPLLSSGSRRGPGREARPAEDRQRDRTEGAKAAYILKVARSLGIGIGTVPRLAKELG